MARKPAKRRPAKRKLAKRKPAKRKRKPARKRKTLSTRRVKSALEGVGRITERAMAEGPDFNPDEHLGEFKDAVRELTDAVAGFKRELKRLMLRDGKFESKGPQVHAELRLLPGRPKGSKDPDDYDLIAHRVQ